jgi:hypothetical protein
MNTGLWNMDSGPGLRPSLNVIGDGGRAPASPTDQVRGLKAHGAADFAAAVGRVERSETRRRPWPEQDGGLRYAPPALQKRMG